MKKLLLIATSAFVVSAYPALAADPAPTDAPAATAEKPVKPDFRRGQDMFTHADTNADGVVTKEEFMANSEKFFGTLDPNSDGKITKEEMEAKKAEWRKKMQEIRAKRQAEKAKEAPAEEKKAE